MDYHRGNEHFSPTRILICNCGKRDIKELMNKTHVFWFTGYSSTFNEDKVCLRYAFSVTTIWFKVINVKQTLFHASFCSKDYFADCTLKYPSIWDIHDKLSCELLLFPDQIYTSCYPNLR